MKGDIVVKVPGANIPVVDNGDGSFSFVTDFMIDGDGPDSLNLSRGKDPCWQPSTSYRPFGQSVDSDIFPCFVLPPEVFLAVKGRVFGCKGVVENLLNGKVQPATPYDVGPAIKIGEGSIDLAEDLGVPDSPTTGGDTRIAFRFTFWPEIPFVWDGRTYPLQAYLSS